MFFPNQDINIINNCITEYNNKNIKYSLTFTKMPRFGFSKCPESLMR